MKYSEANELLDSINEALKVPNGTMALSFLRTKADYFESKESFLDQIMAVAACKQELEVFLKENPKLRGVAANEIGWKLPMIAYNHNSLIVTCINPVVSNKLTKWVDKVVESSPIFPGIFVTVERQRDIEVEYYHVNKQGSLGYNKKKLSKTRAYSFQAHVNSLHGYTILDNAEVSNGGNVIRTKSEMFGLDYYIEGENLLMFEEVYINPDKLEVKEPIGLKLKDKEEVDKFLSTIKSV